jgi:hypothetical protein
LAERQSNRVDPDNCQLFVRFSIAPVQFLHRPQDDFPRPLAVRVAEVEQRVRALAAINGACSGPYSLTSTAAVR